MLFAVSRLLRRVSARVPVTSPTARLCLILGLLASPLGAQETVTLGLSNLSRIYDGAPAALVPASDFTISPGEIADYRFQITYAGKTAAPTNANSYAVRVIATHLVNPSLSATVTDTLLVAKAPLVVTADDQARLLGVANPRLTLRYDGFVAGQTETALSRRPVAKTTAKTGSPAGTYEIQVVGGLAKNYEIVARHPGVLTVIPAFPGTYEALLFDFPAPTTPAGKLILTLPARGANFTGRLELADEGAVIPLSGKLSPNAELTGATGFAERRLRNGDTYRVEVTATPEGLSARLFLRENGTVDNIPVYDQAAPARLRPYTRPVYSPAAGAYTLALLDPTPTDYLTFHHPGGAGFATATIANTGLLKLTGLLADGSKFTASLSPDADATYRLFARPYGTRPGSYAAGAFALEPHPDSPERFHVPDLTRAITWHKAPKPSGSPDKLFPEGFSLEAFLVLDPWLAPAAARRATSKSDAIPAITLAQRLGLAANETLSGIAPSTTTTTGSATARARSRPASSSPRPTRSCPSSSHRPPTPPAGPSASTPRPAASPPVFASPTSPFSQAIPSRPFPSPATSRSRACSASPPPASPGSARAISSCLRSPTPSSSTPNPSQPTSKSDATSGLSGCWLPG